MKIDINRYDDFAKRGKLVAELPNSLSDNLVQTYQTWIEAVASLDVEYQDREKPND